MNEIIGFVLLYFLPGFFITLLLKENWLDKVILSIGFSILINIFFGFILGFLQLLTRNNLLFLDMVFCLSLFVFLSTNKKIKSFNFNKDDVFLALTLIVLCAFIFFLIYKVHYDFNGVYQSPDGKYLKGEHLRYDYPMHGDEWTHLAQAVYVMDSKSIGFVNPYIQKKTFHRDLESGFHIFIAEHFLLTNTEPSANYKFLPALFAVITSLFIFLFIRKITNDYIGFLSMIFFSTLKSNINMMGTWFFVPFTMSFFMIFLYFYFLINIKSKTNYKELLILFLLMLISAFIYPFVTVLMVSVSLVYYAINMNYKKQKIFWSVLLIISILFFFSLKSISFLEELIFKSEWTLGTMGTITYNLIPSIGVLNLLFAVAGVFYTIKKRLKILLIMPAIFLLNILIHQILHFTILIGYQRCVYYFMLSIVPLSAVGIFYVLNFIRISLTKKVKKYYPIIPIIVLLPVLFFSYKDYYNIVEQKNIADKDSLNLVPLIFVDEEGIEAIKLVDEKYEEGIVVLANNLLSFAIYPMSKNHVVGIQGANLGTGKFRGRQYFEFVNADACWETLFITKNFNVTVVITNKDFTNLINSDDACLENNSFTRKNKEFFVYNKSIELLYKKGRYNIYEFKQTVLEENISSSSV